MKRGRTIALLSSRSKHGIMRALIDKGLLKQWDPDIRLNPKIVAKLRWKELFFTNNLGIKSMSEIQQWLGTYNLRLRDQPGPSTIKRCSKCGQIIAGSSPTSKLMQEKFNREALEWIKDW